MVPGVKDLIVRREGAEADPQCTGMVPGREILKVRREGAWVDPQCTGRVPGPKDLMRMRREALRPTQMHRDGAGWRRRCKEQRQGRRR